MSETGGILNVREPKKHAIGTNLDWLWRLGAFFLCLPPIVLAVFRFGVWPLEAENQTAFAKARQRRLEFGLNRVIYRGKGDARA